MIRRPSRRKIAVVALACIGVCGGPACGRHPPPAPAPTLTDGSATLGASTNEPPAAADARADVESPAIDAEVEDARVSREEHPPAAVRCPKEMVNVANRFCVDRYEDTLVDDATGARLSPHYPPEPSMALRMFERWQEERLTLGPPEARAMALPLLPEIERIGDFLPRAVSAQGTLPQGYISGRVAAEACARAKKRLCTHAEWTFACRGEDQTKYPYGRDYRAGACNVFRSSHPSQKLHGNASIGHSDPRLGLVADSEGPLLRPTGATKMCASRWGKDSIYDMVGNQDEWIDDPDGTFVGGFYSRSTKEGCDSIVTVHPLLHWDYSIGLRCCR